MSALALTLVLNSERNGLIEAFRLARYCLDLDSEEVELAVGHVALQIEARLPRAHTFAYITAYNPLGVERSTAENEAADQQLRAQIDRMGYPRWPMSSIGVDGEHWEPGWLVADASRLKLDEWAYRFRQAATLAWRRGEPVRLRMYAHKPEFDAHDDIDWITPV